MNDPIHQTPSPQQSSPIAAPTDLAPTDSAPTDLASPTHLMAEIHAAWEALHHQPFLQSTAVTQLNNKRYQVIKQYQKPDRYSLKDIHLEMEQIAIGNVLYQRFENEAWTLSKLPPVSLQNHHRPTQALFSPELILTQVKYLGKIDQGEQQLACYEYGVINPHMPNQAEIPHQLWVEVHSQLPYQLVIDQRQKLPHFSFTEKFSYPQTLSILPPV